MKPSRSHGFLPDAAVPPSISRMRLLCQAVAIGGIGAVIAGCGGGGGDAVSAPVDPVAPAPSSVRLACSEDPALPTSIKAAFEKDHPDTTVLAVREFKTGDTIRMGTTGGGSGVATADLCLVKLQVGPGISDVAGAPSNTTGIGIQVWMPSEANWNERIRSYGNGGWSGSAEKSLTAFSSSGDGTANQINAAYKGFLVTTSDNGTAGSASAFMRSDGSINTALWKDFAERSLHETAVKAKALAQAYYGKAHKYAYFDGFSTGGRQALKMPQVFPEDYDGVLAGAPAINWTSFISSELYPSIVLQEDLAGVAIASAKSNAVRDASIAACKPAGMYGTLNLLTDPAACRYDPTRDAAVLCAGEVGNYGVVGANANAASCVTLREATAMNKMWYGQTSDGSVPDPALDNGTGPYVNSSNKQLWFGLARGMSPTSLASATNPFAIATDQAALTLQNGTYGGTSFRNAATGDGARNWRFLGYAGNAFVSTQGLALQSAFSHINTDNPDLNAFKVRGGKVLMYHGLTDNLIMPAGSVNYYHRVAAMMGGTPNIEGFFRFFTIPGLGHSGAMGGAGAGSGATPIPTSSQGRDELFSALVKWREQGVAPEQIVVQSGAAAAIQRSVPLCPYPTKATYDGMGDENIAASYSCR